jgi:hypothetical protein
MATTHISVDDAASEMPQRLASAQAAEDIVIDDGTAAPVRLAPASSPRHGTPISEVIARLQAIEDKHEYPLVVDEDYAADTRQIIADRKPCDISAWD